MSLHPGFIRCIHILSLLCGMLCFGSSARARSDMDTGSINRLLRHTHKVLNPDTAILLYNTAFHLSKDAGYADGAFLALITKGIKYFEKQDFASYRSTTYEALKWAENSTMPDAVAWCYNNIGEAWFSEGDYIMANEFYYKGLSELNKKTKEITHTTVNIYNSLGLVNMRMNQPDKALEYYNKAESAALKANLKYQLAIAYENKGVYYLAMQQPDSAERYFNMEMQIGTEINKIDLKAFAFAQLGKTYVSRGEYKKAIGSLESAVALANGRFSPTLVDAACSLGDALRLTGKDKEAETILHWAKAEARRHNYKDYYITCYSKLATLYRSRGDAARALAYMDTLLTLKDSLTSTSTANAINNLEIKYKMSEKDRQLAESRLLIEKQEGTLTSKNILIASVMGGVCLLAILFIVVYRNTRHKQMLQEEIIKSLQQEKTIGILNAMVEGEEKERTRLARELHDGIGGMVSAAMMRFSTIPRHAPFIKREPSYNDAMALLGEIGEVVRKTSHNLMPEVLLKQSLPDAISSLCNAVQVDDMLTIDHQFYGNFDVIQQDMKLNIYRIIQELLKNVTKHADATEVLVQIMAHDKSINITVEDNGKGFDTSVTGSGMGLQNLQARVESLGGHYTLESMDGRGTTVYIELEQTLEVDRKLTGLKQQLTDLYYLLTTKYI